MANPRVRREICGNSGAERINLASIGGLVRSKSER